MKDLRHTNLIQLYAVGLWLNLNQIYAASKYTTLKILTEMNQVKWWELVLKIYQLKWKSYFFSKKKILRQPGTSDIKSNLGKVTISEPILIITELMVNGALNKYLQSPAGQLLTQKVSYSYECIYLKPHFLLISMLRSQICRVLTRKKNRQKVL